MTTLIPVRCITLVGLVLVGAVLAGCGGQPEGTAGPDEAKAIAKDAYIYGFPMVMNCKTVYDYAVNVDSPDYKGPFNQVSCEARLFTPDDKAVVTPNADTPYCMFWMDLRSEPLVISVPEIEPERFYHVQLVDWYTHNFAYIGTRTNGNKAGKYLLAGPGWQGDMPNGITEVIRSETDLIFAIIRTQLFDSGDLARVEEIQNAYALQPLSSFMGGDAPPQSQPIDFPAWVGGSEYSAAALEYLDFALDLVGTHIDEVEMMERFARIGIGTPGDFTLDSVDPDIAGALEEGVQEGLAEMQAFAQELSGDPLSSVYMFGTREYLKRAAARWKQPSFYLQRATAAMMGLYGNSGEEAVYPGYLFDDEGKPYDASEHYYVMKFEGGEMPPVKAFWSLSMYDAKTQLFIHNPIDRYLLNSGMSERFLKEPDGSLVFYIQKDTPGKHRESNWLPAPDGPFYLVLRLYYPEPEVLEGRWEPPTLDEVE